MAAAAVLEGVLQLGPVAAEQGCRAREGMLLALPKEPLGQTGGLSEQLLVQQIQLTSQIWVVVVAGHLTAAAGLQFWAAAAVETADLNQQYQHMVAAA